MDVSNAGQDRPRIPRLRTLYVYTNEECNLACRHCWLGAPTSRAKRASAPLSCYKEFLEEALALGLKAVKISGGEPLLRKDFVLDLLTFAHNHKIATHLETNGTLVDEEVAEVAATSGTEVSVSLDGSTAQLHERLRRVPGCFEGAVDGIRRLKDHSVPVEIVTALYRSNATDINNIHALAGRLLRPGPARLKVNPIVASGRATQMYEAGECLSAVELLSFVRSMEIRYSRAVLPLSITCGPAFFSLTSISRSLVGGGRCSFRELLGVLADGHISFCGMGYTARAHIFGHISDCDLASFWNTHPALFAVRGNIPGKLEGICGNCVFRSTCQGGCRAHAYSVYGSLLAPAPPCQSLYEVGAFPPARMVDRTKDVSYLSSPAAPKSSDLLFVKDPDYTAHAGGSACT